MHFYPKTHALARSATHPVYISERAEIDAGLP